MANDIYSVFDRIMVALDWISQGHTKTEACDHCGISTTVFDHHTRLPGPLMDLAAEAQQRGYDALADALVTINTSQHGSSDPKMASVLSKNIQWYLSRRRPKEYGDRVTIEHNITADKVIIEALQRGKSRALERSALEGITYSVIGELSADEQAELEKLY